MKKEKMDTYPLDNSAIIHLAALEEGCSNSFRLSVCLKEVVLPQLLQEAFNTVSSRFPTLVAGIQRGSFHHIVVPVGEVPNIEQDHALLVYMPPQQITRCAMRVLYGETRISVEFFHSLTDGYGGFQFLTTLLAEYFRLAHGVICASSDNLILADSPLDFAEVEDSYAVYAGGKKSRLNHNNSYQIVSEESQTSEVHATTLIYPVKELLQTAHEHHVTLTTLLTAVMGASIMELQMRQAADRKLKLVQIMVPINLRKLFPSRSLRNFSLYALPCIRPEEANLSFDAILDTVDGQLNKQLSREAMQAMISTNVGLENNRFFRGLPLAIKCAGLRLGFHFFGARNSSISLSNMGELHFPEEMSPYIERAEFLLTPRLHGTYNCGVVSFDGQVYINFSRNCLDPEKEGR